MVRLGRMTTGRVAIRFVSPDSEVCVTAPCKWTTPALSSFQPGAVDPKPALPDQLAVFTAIGAGGDSMGAALAPAAPSVATPRAAARVLSPAVTRNSDRRV